MVVGMTHHAGIRIAEVGFLLLLFGGVWLIASEVAFFGWARARAIVAGAAFAVGGVLLIVATHWGHFG
jgi:hypothetical protein